MNYGQNGRDAAQFNFRMEARHRSRKPKLNSTHTLPEPTTYAQALIGELSEFAIDEVRAPLIRGAWRERIFREDSAAPMDLEIGTGNGRHFAMRAVKHPERKLVGFELKYKPLIQSIERALRAGSRNARIVRYDASLVSDIFSAGELNDVFIHFPDPWPRMRQWKHRLINAHFLGQLFELQRPGSMVDFKTDSRHYFEWAMEYFVNSKYTLSWHTFDLHKSEHAAGNSITQFEKIFLDQGLPIHAARLLRL